jgi:hypothetical protein
MGNDDRPRSRENQVSTMFTIELTAEEIASIKSLAPTLERFRLFIPHNVLSVVEKIEIAIGEIK